MNTSEISSVLKYAPETRNIFLGTFPSDMLPEIKSVKKKLCFIANTDSSEKPGTHWVAFYGHLENGGKFIIDYFDTYGREPQTNIKKYLKNNFDYCVFNGKEIQSSFTTICGLYSIYMLIKRSSGMDFSTIVNNFKEKSQLENDTAVADWCNEKLGLNEPLIDLDSLT